MTTISRFDPDAPRRLGYSRLDESGRFLSAQECERIARQVLTLANGGGNTKVWISSWWSGALRWARNRASLAGDRRDIKVTIERELPNGTWATVETNQLDEVSIEAAKRTAERLSALYADRMIPLPPLEPPTLPEPPETAIWSDATTAATTEIRGQVTRAITEGAESKGMLSAGYLDVRAAQVLYSYRIDGHEQTRYDRYTNAQCSMTVRHPRGTGSGWAGLASYDWSDIDAGALAERALQKCLTSLDPVRLEPGRYTVILEPQAVYQLVSFITDRWYSRRRWPEETRSPRHPFTLGWDDALKLLRSKLGTKIVDERVTISFDPLDPVLGIIPYQVNARDGYLEPVTPIKWIDRGVLTGLSYDRTYALEKLNDHLGVQPGLAFRMSGGDSSIEEMISSTKRGLLVTRFSNMSRLDPESVLMTGLTRDGLWLIENGKITKAVKNFRFTESPLFVLNSLEALGTPVPVFTNGRGALAPAIVPPLKARDFSFTSLIDAI